MDLREGTLVANRYRLARELGRGGMGAVWLAQHVELQTPCAVKFILSEAARDEEIRARFAREAKAAAQMRSPNVVQIMDYGVWEGIPYLAMEYLEGEDLGQRLRRLGRLTPEQTVFVIGQAVRGLTRAHGAGIVHRDLKPDNLFIVRDDDQEIVKILDFGIAKSTTGGLEGSQTRTGMMVGTPFYMSPEQAQGLKGIDHRSDLWALGVIVFECLTGGRPFESDALGDLLMRIMVHPLPQLTALAPGLPRGIDAWWARAASRPPEQRFQSAKELHEQLAAALGLPLEGGPRSSFASMAPSPLAGTEVQLPRLGGTTGAVARTMDPAPPTPAPNRVSRGGTALLMSDAALPISAPAGKGKLAAGLGALGLVAALGITAGVVAITRQPTPPAAAAPALSPAPTAAAPSASAATAEEVPVIAPASAQPVAALPQADAAPAGKPRPGAKAPKDPKDAKASSKAPPDAPPAPPPPKGKTDMGF